MPTPVYYVVVFALLVSLATCPLYIIFSRRLQFGQQIRLDGPQQHLKKAGTPTMGGIVYLFSFVVALILFAPKTPFLLMLILITLAGAFLGFLDDFQKVIRRQSLGLKARQKLLGQFVFTVVFYYLLQLYGHSTVVGVPFSSLQIDFGHFYFFLIFLMLTGTSNAVNLTDGIDGLAAGTVILGLFTFLMIAYWQGMTDVVYFCGALIGACMGFLVFNIHPARIFMGDVGSLSLGAALAAVAIITKSELYLVIIGGVFVLETMSVIVQVLYFRLTARRVFLMSPLHHHFEFKGWPEWHVVIGFWALGLCFAVLGLIVHTPLMQ